MEIFSGANRKVLADFLAFDSPFTGGVRVAAADVNGDGIPDILAAPGPGDEGQVHAFDGKTLSALDAILVNIDSDIGQFVAGSLRRRR